MHYSHRLCFLIFILASFGKFGLLPTFAQEDIEKEPSKPEWNVAEPPMTGKREVEIDVGAGTWINVDVSPDGNTIAFDMLGDIYLIPISGGEAKNISPGLAWDTQPRFSPDGSKIAFTSDRSGGNNIWVMDVSGENPRQITDESFRLLNSASWHPDGNYIAARKHYTTKRSLGTGEIWIYHLNGGEGVAVVERPDPKFQKELGEPAFSPDGKSIYYAFNKSPGLTFEYAQNSHQTIFEIRKVNLKTGRSSAVISAPGGSIRPTPSPDGRQLAFIRRVKGKSALFIKDLVSGRETMVYAEMDQDMQESWAVHGIYPNMDWLPDSSAVVFWAKGKIKRVNANTGKVREVSFRVVDKRTIFDPPQVEIEVAPEIVKSKMIRWAVRSPLDESLVFSAFGRLYRQATAESEPILLISEDDGDHFELYPVFSPDGQWIVFVTWNDETLGAIRKVSSKGGKSTIISSTPGHYLSPSVSPNGKLIAVERIKGGHLTSAEWSEAPGIYLFPFNGGEEGDGTDEGTKSKGVRVTHQGIEPQFSHDSSRILYHQVKKDKHLLNSVNLKGEDEKTIATGEFPRHFRLSPDNKWLAFIENYEVYLTPMPEIGKALSIGPKSKALPTIRVSSAGGSYLNWSANNRLNYSMGAELFSVTVEEVSSKDFKAPVTNSGRKLSLKMPADKPETKVALTGARLLTMDEQQRVIEKGVILVNGNRIEQVGSAVQVIIPDDAIRIDMSGKTITPGFIDAHAHGRYGVEGIVPQQSWPQYATLAFGVTTVHDPSNPAEQVFAASEYQQAGLVLAPRIFSTGNIVYGAKSEAWAQIETYEDALAHVQRLKSQGAYSIKNYNQPRRDQRQMVVQACRELGLNVVAEGGALYQMDMNMIVDGNTGIEHSLPNQAIYDDVLQFWPQTKTGYTPTLVVGYGAIKGEDFWYQHTDVWKHPLLSRFVPPHILRPRSIRVMKAPDEDYGQFSNGFIGKQLADRGVSVHIGAHGQREGLASHWEMWMFVQAGMSTMEALKTATSAPASYLGYAKDLGSIEKGKLADLVIMNANPLKDIRNTEKLDSVMLNGRLYDAKTLNETKTGNHVTRKFYWQ